MLQLRSVSQRDRPDSSSQKSTENSASAASRRHPYGSGEALERDYPQFLFTPRASASEPTLWRGWASHHVTGTVVLGWGSGSVIHTGPAYMRLGTLSYHLRRNHKTQVEVDTFPSGWGRKKEAKQVLLTNFQDRQSTRLRHGGTWLTALNRLLNYSQKTFFIGLRMHCPFQERHGG